MLPCTDWLLARKLTPPPSPSVLATFLLVNSTASKHCYFFQMSLNLWVLDAIFGRHLRSLSSLTKLWSIFPCWKKKPFPSGPSRANEFSPGSLSNLYGHSPLLVIMPKSEILLLMPYRKKTLGLSSCLELNHQDLQWSRLLASAEKKL